MKILIGKLCSILCKAIYYILKGLLGLFFLQASFFVAVSSIWIIWVPTFLFLFYIWYMLSAALGKYLIGDAFYKYPPYKTYPEREEYLL